MTPDPDEYLAEAQLPPEHDDIRNIAGMDTKWVLLDPGYEVAEWHPLPDGKGDPTQVHIYMQNSSVNMGVVMRLKSKRAVNELIATLRRHRDSVFK